MRSWRFLFTAVVVIILLFLISSASVFSQGKDTDGDLKGKETVFIELLGNGGWYSLNYDRVFFHKRRDALTWRAGLTYMPYTNHTQSSEISLLGECNYLRGKRRHFLELGIGFTYWRVFRVDQHLDQERYINFYLFPRIGYRYQKAEGGMFFRVGFLPGVLLDWGLEQRLSPFGGVSFGYTLKKARIKDNPECSIH